MHWKRASMDTCTPVVVVGKDAALCQRQGRFSILDTSFAIERGSSIAWLFLPGSRRTGGAMYGILVDSTSTIRITVAKEFSRKCPRKTKKMKAQRRQKCHRQILRWYGKWYRTTIMIDSSSRDLNHDCDCGRVAFLHDIISKKYS